MKFITYLMMLSCFLLSNNIYAAQKIEKAEALKTSSISGQVFVVTKGSENIKLALVWLDNEPTPVKCQQPNNLPRTAGRDSPLLGNEINQVTPP
jgi:hypothetical protein